MGMKRSFAHFFTMAWRALFSKLKTSAMFSTSGNGLIMSQTIGPSMFGFLPQIGNLADWIVNTDSSDASPEDESPNVLHIQSN